MNAFCLFCLSFFLFSSYVVFLFYLFLFYFIFPLSLLLRKGKREGGGGEGGGGKALDVEMWEEVGGGCGNSWGK